MLKYPGLFITGTDTDAGKSVISAGILYALIHHFGCQALPVKPLQTGIEKTAEGFTIPDLDYSLQVARLELTTEQKHQLAPYCFEPACSPHLAADIAGTLIQLEEVIQAIRHLENSRQLLVVEGAGGLMVPLNHTQTNLDLIAALHYPTVLVVRNGLGCVNHALMSLNLMKQKNIHVLGFISNDVTPCQPKDQFIRDDNPKIIAELSGLPCLGNVTQLTQNSKNQIAWTTAHEDCPQLFQQLLNH